MVKCVWFGSLIRDDNNLFITLELLYCSQFHHSFIVMFLWKKKVTSSWKYMIHTLFTARSCPSLALSSLSKASCFWSFLSILVKSLYDSSPAVFILSLSQVLRSSTSAENSWKLLAAMSAALRLAAEALRDCRRAKTCCLRSSILLTNIEFSYYTKYTAKVIH